MKPLIMASTFFFFMFSANAEVVKAMKDNQTQLVQISANQPNKFYVAGDRISQIYSKDGAYTDKTDLVSGAVFITPTKAYQTKSFNLYLRTEQGHAYNFLLVPVSITGQTIQVKPLSPTLAADHWEQSSDYSKVLTNLIGDMVNNKQPDGYAVNAVSNKKVFGYGGRVTLQLQKVYRGAKLTGEILSVKNAIGQNVSLDERAFYQPGTRAIAFQDQSLAPGQSTVMYRVMSHDE